MAGLLRPDRTMTASIITALGTLILWIGAAGLLPAQGTGSGAIRFANRGPGLDAPFFRSDGQRAAGSNFVAALYVAATNSSAFSQIGPTQRFGVGVDAGYWNPSSVSTGPFPAGASVRVQVRFWDTALFSNASFAEAEAQGLEIGVAEIPNLTLNGDGSPTPMFGLQSASLIPTLTLTLGATKVAFDPANSSGGSQLGRLCDIPVGTNRWFRLTSPRPGTAVLNTDGSLIDTVMAAFRGSIVNVSALQPLACNDDRSPTQVSSAFNLPVEANQLYLICIAGKHGVSGPVQLNYTTGISLTIRRFPGRALELTWPAGQGNFQLESAPHPGPSASWQPIGEFPFLIDDRYLVPLPASEFHRCFRLRALP